MPQMSCSVIGAGKLGAPLAAVLASFNIKTIAVDVSKEVVDLINAGIAPVKEPGLQNLITLANKTKNLIATTDVNYAIKNSDITFVIVPTPSDRNGNFSNAYLLQAILEIGLSLKNKSSYHLVNITSTVMPGSVNGEIKSCLEKYANRKIGNLLGLCYNPEFVALGSVIDNMITPDMILIGQSDNKAGDVLENVYRKICINKDIPIKRMNIVNAEITKLAINTYLTNKISFANMLSNICERIPYSSVEQVTSAMGLDSRIGHKYLQGGLPYGGPCFPRDTIAFRNLAKKNGVCFDMIVGSDNVNNQQIDRLINRINLFKNYFNKNDQFTVLGISYKDKTPVLENSPSMILIKKLLDLGKKIQVFDPMTSKFALLDKLKPYLLKNKNRLAVCNSLNEGILKSKVIIVMTKCFEFKKLPFYLNPNSSKIIFDCWRQIDVETCKAFGSIVVQTGNYYHFNKLKI